MKITGPWRAGDVTLRRGLIGSNSTNGSTRSATATVNALPSPSSAERDHTATVQDLETAARIASNT